MQVMQFSV